MKLKEWTAGGLISSSQADAIRKTRPHQEEEAGSRLVRVLYCISGLLIAAGVISFFAYNWDKMPRGLKLSLIMAGFIGAHTAGLYGAKDKEPVKPRSEFFHFIGTLFFGAALSLISQIYNTGGNASSFLFLWSAAAVSMAYALKSTPQMMITGALLAAWLFTDAACSSRINIIYPAAAVIPFALIKKHWLPTSIAFAVMVITLSVHLFSGYSIPFDLAAFTLCALFAGTGLVISRSEPGCAASIVFPSYKVFYILLLYFTFYQNLKEIYRFGSLDQAEHNTLLWYPLALCAVSAGIWIYYFMTHKKQPDEPSLLGKCLQAAPFIGFITSLLLYLASKNSGSDNTAAAFSGSILYNIIAAGCGLGLCASGVSKGRPGLAFIGSAYLVILILCRFFAYTDDFLSKSAAFLLCGAFMLLITVKTANKAKAGTQ